MPSLFALKSGACGQRKGEEIFNHVSGAAERVGGAYKLLIGQ